MTTIDLANTLLDIEQNDQNYEHRYVLVLKAMYLAALLGYKTSIRMDSIEDGLI